MLRSSSSGSYVKSQSGFYDFLCENTVCVNLNALVAGYYFSLYVEVRSGEGSSCEQQLNNSSLVPDSVEEIRVFQACTSGWRCDTKCRALAHTRKCAFFLLVSVPCFVASANAISQETFCHLRHVSVHLCLCNSRLQQSAHVSAFSLLSSSTVLVLLVLR